MLLMTRRLLANWPSYDHAYEGQLRAVFEVSAQVTKHRLCQCVFSGTPHWVGPH